MEKVFKDRPTNRQVDLYCEKCDNKVQHFMTNEEIFKETKIQQYCKICNKITKYILK